MHSLKASEVCSSPEFKAFCERFGVQHELPAKPLTIYITADEAVTTSEENEVQKAARKGFETLYRK